MTPRLLVVALAAVGALAAQDPPSRVGRISFVSGAVSFDPAGVDQWTEATVNRPLTIGDQLYADNGGRAEVHVPGTAFRLGDRAAFEFMNLSDQIVQVRLSEGTLDVKVRNLYGTVEIDSPNIAFTVTRPGEYRLDVNPDNGQTNVTVRDGEGQVTGGSGAFTIRAGQQVALNGQDQSAQYQVYAAPAPDEFDNWVLGRNGREDRYAHPRYVSEAMVGYEDLGEYGSWRSALGYGQVWVPNGVAAGWAPYQAGHWAWVDPWGWSWVDDAPWGFAPFHYGRWAFVDGYWGWCPGPVAAAPIYAPALVAWVGFGGGFGASIGFGAGPAVGWFPLGPRDVYIPAFTASAAYVNRINVTNSTIIQTTNVTNVYNTYVRTGSVPVNTYTNRTVPNAVVVVPQTALGTAQPVRQIARRLPANQLNAINTSAPAPRVAPQVASVMGHAAAGNVPRPPAAVLSRQVVARAAPPPPPPSFQQRQAILEKNPGHPVPVAQLQQMARTAPAAPLRPPVKVVSQARPVTPHVVNTPAPRTAPTTATAPSRQPAPAPAQAQQRPTTPAPAPNRSFEPPAAQQRAAQPPPRQPAPAQAQQHPVPTPAQPRSTPPPAQERAAQPPPRQPAPAQAQQRPAPTPAQPRSNTPPPSQQRAAQPPPRQSAPAQAQQRPAPTPAQPRAAEPPAPHPAPAQAQQRQSPPRSPSPPPAEQHAAPPPRPPAPQNAQQRQAPQRQPPPAPPARGQAERSAPPPKKDTEHH